MIDSKNCKRLTAQLLFLSQFNAPGVWIKLDLVDRRLFEFAVYSSLLLLKKSFYAFFLTAVYLAFIPLVYYTINKRLGVYLQLPLQDPAFILDQALNQENTVTN